ncbi:MAG: IPT/TIG domain-containing protein [Treponema sp.]|nr:IPT/TIG domain-containing protein [Treponema sp.]
MTVAIAVSLFIGKKNTKNPVISSIDPPIASPEEILTIRGNNFGNEKENSYVSISNSRITNSKYISWSDSEIIIKLPSNVQDGLVTVITQAGPSTPAFFANKSSIPTTVRKDPKATVPIIQNITTESGSEISLIGQTITISGINFNTSRGTSKVYFSANKETPSENDFIAALPTNYDYEYWSDDEIKVRVPDSADSGFIYVETDRGKSEPYPLQISFPAGKKIFSTPRTYVLQTSVNLRPETENTDALITLYMPRPQVSTFQPEVTTSAITPEPLIQDDIFNIIFQDSLDKTVNTNTTYSATNIVKTYTISANIIPGKIINYSDKTKILYKSYISPDKGIPSINPKVLELKDSIIGKTKNNYEKARQIYMHMVNNFKISALTDPNSTSSPEDLISTGSGDAYSFAILYTALCRAAGIPAVPQGGVLIDTQYTTKNHWWTELYFERYGWFPVDTALGAGLEYSPFTEITDRKNYYFGNIDNQHISFCRGWNQIKSSFINSRTVKRPRSYALQSIWEEARGSEANYSSLWNAPAIIGIY